MCETPSPGFTHIPLHYPTLSHAILWDKCGIFVGYCGKDFMRMWDSAIYPTPAQKAILSMHEKMRGIVPRIFSCIE